MGFWKKAKAKATSASASYQKFQKNQRVRQDRALDDRLARAKEDGAYWKKRAALAKAERGVQTHKKASQGPSVSMDMGGMFGGGGGGGGGDMFSGMPGMSGGKSQKRGGRKKPRSFFDGM